jgi:hypothetical protein
MSPIHMPNATLGFCGFHVVNQNWNANGLGPMSIKNPDKGGGIRGLVCEDTSYLAVRFHATSMKRNMKFHKHSCWLSLTEQPL